MKIINEFTKYLIILFIVFVSLLEVEIFCYIIFRYNKAFEKIKGRALVNSSEKAVQLTGKINYFISTLFIRYKTDLKLMGKHMLLYVGNDENPQKIINKSTSFLLNNNKSIINADLTELLSDNNINKYYNSSTKKLDYIHYYENEFKNNYDSSYIIEELFDESKHNELNMISYFSANNSNITEEKEKQETIKYLMTILKTIFIRRYISKREYHDYTRFLLINEDEIFIYPPEDYRNINLYSFPYMYNDTSCSYHLNENKTNGNFPKCVYDYIVKKYEKQNKIYPFIFKTKYNYEEFYFNICVIVPFLRNSDKNSYICIELNIVNIFNSLSLDTDDNLEFGVLSDSNNALIPFYYNNQSVYEKIKQLFNDSFFGEFAINQTNTNQATQKFRLFHFLNYKYFENIENKKINTPKATVFSDLKQEYTEIRQIFVDNIKISSMYSMSFFNISKSFCTAKLHSSQYECLKDNSSVIIFALTDSMIALSDNYLDKNETIGSEVLFYLFAISGTHPIYTNQKIQKIMLLKIMRLIIFQTLLSLILLTFYYILISLFLEGSFQMTEDLIELIDKIYSNQTVESRKEFIQNNLLTSGNKEMRLVLNINDSISNLFNLKHLINESSNISSNDDEIYNLIQNMKDSDTKEMCNLIAGVRHYRSGGYELAENEFNLLIKYLNEKEINVLRSNNYTDEKLKDSIKRSSDTIYLNEYFDFNRDETWIPVVKFKILKQKILYLFGMVKYNLAVESSEGNLWSLNLNKPKNKKDNEKIKKYLEEAIKYFSNCKNINSALGINIIKQIFSLLMISRCYMILNEYKESIKNINKALNNFLEFSKIFKDTKNKCENSKIMIFIENNIFQHIIYTYIQFCYKRNSPNAGAWLILKMFENSPFIISNIHLDCSVFIHHFLDKVYQNQKRKPKELQNIRDYFYKLYSRISNNKISTGGVADTSSFLVNKTEKTHSHSHSHSHSNKRENVSSKLNTISLRSINKNTFKTITVCISEKVLTKINGPELKDVLIKYMQKYFSDNSNDRFSFIQFSVNGKATAFIKPEKLDVYIKQLQKMKNIFEFNEIIGNVSNLKFMEFSSLFNTIIKSYVTKDDSSDNIILMIINSEDIRFTSKEECVSVVDELNKYNASVFILCYDEVIKSAKVNDIYYLLNGFTDGHFFQIKNYQQIKQIFISLSSKNHQANFFDFDYSTFDLLL